MNEQPFIPERFFDRFDESLSDSQRLEMLKECEKWFTKTEHDLNRDIPLSAEDIVILREYTKDKSPAIRKFAVGFLCELENVSWNDLEMWVDDSNEDVRSNVLSAIESSTTKANRLCVSDKPKCLALIMSAASKHIDYQAGITLKSLSEEDGWLEMTWKTAEHLLDQENDELTVMLACTYFEHVIPENNWGPEDPHIRVWIGGNNFKKQMLLLKIAEYMGLSDGRLGAIVKALTSSRNKTVAGIARGMLNGTSVDLWSKDSFLPEDFV